MRWFPSRRRSAAAPPPPAETPFLRARDEWDDRYSRLGAQAANWRFVALVLLILNIFVSAGSYQLATRSRVVPYIVTVDSLGQPVAFGPVEPLKHLDERLYRYLLSLWLFNARSVVSDTEAQKALLFSAYAYAEGDATTFLNTHYRENSPFARAKDTTVSVQVNSVLKLSPRTWQIEWTETSRTAVLGGTSQEKWRAVVETRLEPPAKTDAILANPVGLWLTAINWTRLTP